MSGKREHTISVVIEGSELKGWLEYEIHSSLIDPADAFSLVMPFDQDAYNLCERDSRVRVLIDGTVILDGFIDDRLKKARDGTFSIGGRDRAGRVVQESAPAINYSALDMVEAVRRLVAPWFAVVTLSDARNRALRRGKGRRVPSGKEPIVVNIKAVRAGKVHPGMTCWSIIEEIVTQAGYAAWSSADGREFFIGQPNYTQAPQFLLVHPRKGSTTRSTVLDLQIHESNGDRYSQIRVTGAGGGTDADYGPNCTDRQAVYNDGPNADGTGDDFKYRKRLIMPERDFESNQDAARVADRERKRRDFKRTIVTAEAEGHGQFITGGARTLFAPNTLAHVIDEEADFEDERMLIYSCLYKATRDDGETTQLELVPEGTDLVL